MRRVGAAANEGCKRGRCSYDAMAARDLLHAKGVRVRLVEVCDGAAYWILSDRKFR